MGLKATLKIQLFANDVVVAEAEDERLWQRVLAAIQANSTDLGTQKITSQEEDKDDEDANGEEEGPPGRGLEGLAKELGVSAMALRGACDPKLEAPFLHLDAKNWEAFRRNTPARGPHSISAIKLAATLICLWFKHAGVGRRPTQAEALVVLEDLGVTDNNPSRAISNCSWLQARGDGVQINPAELSRAHAVAKAFVLKSRIEVGE